MKKVVEGVLKRTARNGIDGIEYVLKVGEEEILASWSGMWGLLPDARSKWVRIEIEE